MNGMLVCAVILHVDCLNIGEGNDNRTLQYLI